MTIVRHRKRHQPSHQSTDRTMGHDQMQIKASSASATLQKPFTMKPAFYKGALIRLQWIFRPSNLIRRHLTTAMEPIKISQLTHVCTDSDTMELVQSANPAQLSAALESNRLDARPFELRFRDAHVYGHQELVP